MNVKSTPATKKEKKKKKTYAFDLSSFSVIPLLRFSRDVCSSQILFDEIFAKISEKKIALARRSFIEYVKTLRIKI